MKTESPPTSPGDPLSGEPKELLDMAALAAVAMSHPLAVPDTVFPGALLKIRRRKTARSTARQVFVWGGWVTAAAACLALWMRETGAATPPSVKSGKNGSSGIAGSGHPDATGPGGTGSPAVAGNGGGTETPAEKRGRVSPRGQFRTLPGGSDSHGGDDPDQLRNELRRLSESQQARFQPAPGLARMVVVEMTAPANQKNPRSSLHLTPERVSDIMAAGLSGDRPPEPNAPTNDKPPMRVRPGSRPSEIILEDGLGPLGFLDLPEEVTLRHNAFPVNDWENAGLVRSPDGRFYDPAGHILWEQGTGGQDLGRRVPEGFDASQFATAPRPPDPSPPNTAPAEPVAYTLFDETTGAGSIVLGRLPAAPDGQVYQLWLTDSNQKSPVSAGLLPALDGGAGRVFFDTMAPGFAPSGYFLTLEPAGGSPQPAGEKILSGPQISVP